jgi:hypothetical protein
MGTICLAAAIQINGAVSVHPGKLTGLDKELSKSLDLEVQNATSEAELSSSPVGPLGEASRCENPTRQFSDPAMGGLHAVFFRSHHLLRFFIS